jgi:hypothetical protein
MRINGVVESRPADTRAGLFLRPSLTAIRIGELTEHASLFVTPDSDCRMACRLYMLSL